MRQRVMIAIALACDPDLLIADEPTTALDVTIQAQILDLLRELKARSSLSAIVLITHDLGVVAEICDEVAVMYAGEMVERAPVAALFARPSIPTRSACSARSRGSTAASSISRRSKARCRTWRAPPPGCRFAPRCPFADERCHRERPPIVDVAPDHWSRCIKAPLERLVS